MSPLAAATQTPTPTSAKPMTQAQAQAQGEKPVCRREADTGSLLAVRKTCHTQAEWDAMSRDAGDQVRSTQTNSMHLHSGAGGAG